MVTPFTGVLLDPGIIPSDPVRSGQTQMNLTEFHNHDSMIAGHTQAPIPCLIDNAGVEIDLQKNHKCPEIIQEEIPVDFTCTPLRVKHGVASAL